MEICLASLTGATQTITTRQCLHPSDWGRGETVLMRMWWNKVVLIDAPLELNNLCGGKFGIHQNQSKQTNKNHRSFKCGDSTYMKTTPKSSNREIIKSAYITERTGYHAPS